MELNLLLSSWDVIPYETIHIYQRNVTIIKPGVSRKWLLAAITCIIPLHHRKRHLRNDFEEKDKTYFAFQTSSYTNNLTLNVSVFPLSPALSFSGYHIWPRWWWLYCSYYHFNLGSKFPKLHCQLYKYRLLHCSRSRTFLHNHGMQSNVRMCQCCNQCIRFNDFPFFRLQWLYVFYRDDYCVSSQYWWYTTMQFSQYLLHWLPDKVKKVNFRLYSIPNLSVDEYFGGTADDPLAVYAQNGFDDLNTVQSIAQRITFNTCFQSSSINQLEYDSDEWICDLNEASTCNTGIITTLSPTFQPTSNPTIMIHVIEVTTTEVKEREITTSANDQVNDRM